MGVPSRKRRSYTSEFKAEAVRLVREQKLSVSEVAKDLDLTPSALDRWIKRAMIDARGSTSGVLSTNEREELKRLRKENRVLHEEREILKKAAFFASQSK